MRFWIIVWSFVIAFFGLQTINMFKESNEFTIAMGALTILAIFMWLYSFVHIIVMDFAPLIGKGVCRKLHDLEYFKSFTLDHFTVDWNNEIGFDPMFLYERSILIS